MKTYACDVCNRVAEVKDYHLKFPANWFLVKLYSKTQSKGGTSVGYHLCGKM